MGRTAHARRQDGAYGQRADARPTPGACGWRRSRDRRRLSSFRCRTRQRGYVGARVAARRSGGRLQLACRAARRARVVSRRGRVAHPSAPRCAGASTGQRRRLRDERFAAAGNRVRPTAGSVTNGEGIAGFGGDARLIVIKAGPGDGSFSDVDESNAIVYAVDHGARIINLSLGGPATSTTERKAIDYATSHGALVVAAA